MTTPHQRPCRDRRTVLLPDLARLREAVLLARATGWTVWSARRVTGGLRLTLARG